MDDLIRTVARHLRQTARCPWRLKRRLFQAAKEAEIRGFVDDFVAPSSARAPERVLAPVPAPGVPVPWRGESS
jgi:hypothetical protein